ncbi:Ig-like domain-containing protein [Mycobacterium sp. IDR2000157661]|uniref:Ig-like domain-containing protein n=1 Tax=Mycobacterium sp. IDR2000157661 TaxID=2867005 RepID=UPI001EEB6E0A|nr:Ig-like domain-containing protein [Mycobacterium sp. IDR2000157661]ULE33674.1 cadherin-like domain-containing protein [Mycobacterium sp. IDR2000157661]
MPTEKDAQTVVGLTNPKASSKPAGRAEPQPGSSAERPSANEPVGSLGTIARSEQFAEVRLFSAPAVPGAESTMSVHAAGTPAPAPLRSQPSNLVEAVLGAPMVLANIALTAVSALLTSVVAPGPTTPDPPVMLLVVLGWVQRELQRTFFNRNATAVADAISTSEDAGVSIPVLANDTDPDLSAGDVLTVTDYTQPANGSVVLNSDGTFTYTPDADFNGTDAFSYTISDDASRWHFDGLAGLFGGGVRSSTASVTVTVTASPNPENQAPILTLPAPGTLVPDGNGDVTFSVSGTDPDGSSVTFSANTTQGAITQITPTTFRYTPGDYSHALAADGYPGPDTATITVTATDGNGGTTTSTFTVPVTPTNAPPAPAGPAATGAPNPGNGAVPISFPVTDADQDALTFTDDTDRGDLAVVNGQLVFVPTAQARHAATADAATTADKKVTFTITASDGHGGTTSTSVTVDMESSGVVSTLIAPGTSVGGLQYSPDGSRAILTTQTTEYDAETQTYTTTTRLVTIDTATGQQVGAATTLEGQANYGYYESYERAKFSADGTRASQVTRTVTYDSATGYTYITRVAVVDTVTGTQVGDTITRTGSYIATQYSADGTRLVLTTAESAIDSAAGTSTPTVRVTVVNPATGQQVGPDLTLAGQYRTTEFGADGTAAITAQESIRDEETGSYTYTTRVAVIDLTTGDRVGDVTTVAYYGSSEGWSSMSTPDGTRIVRTISEQTYDEATSSHVETTRVVVIDTTDGQQVGTTVTLAGRDASFQLTADGSRAVVTTREQRYDQSTYSYVDTIRVAMVDTATGEQIGNTLAQNGSQRETQLSADGSRAVLTVSERLQYDQYSGTYAYTTRVTVLDTASAGQIGATTTLTGSSSGLQFTADGTRAVVTSVDQTYNWITGVNTYSTQVAVIDTDTGSQVGSTTTVAGYAYSGSYGDVQLTADGTRAVVIGEIYDTTPGARSRTSSVAVIDVVTGEQVGTAVTLSGVAAPPKFFADDTRAIITAEREIYVDGLRTYTYTTTIALIDVTTGNQIGSTATVSGATSKTLLNADETRLVQVTNDRDPMSNGYSARITVVDTATGDQVGQTVTVRGQVEPYSYRGSVNPTPFTPDGARLVVTTQGYDYDEDYRTRYTTRVVFVDLETGAQVGTTTVLAGNTDGDIQFSADGTRAVQTTYAYTQTDDNTTTYSTQVAVIDAATGTQVGPTTVMSGNPYGTVLSADSARAIQTAYDGDGSDAATRVAVIDLATGHQIGVSAALPGSPAGTARLSADGTRITMTTWASPNTSVTVIDIDQTGVNQRPTVAVPIEVNDPDAEGAVTGSAQFTDPDGDTLSYVGTGATARGSVIVAADGSFVYTPAKIARLAAAKVSASPDAKQDHFTITAYDGHGGATSIVVTVPIEAKNTAPVTSPTIGDFANGVLTGSVNGTDVDGDSLTYSVTSQGGKGSVAVNATTGAFTYTPTADARTAASATSNDVDTDTFVITVSDGRGGSVDQTITVDVAQNGVIADAHVDLPASGALQYSPDGSRAIRVTTVRVRVNDDYYSYDYVDRTSIAVINTATGAQIGETVVIDGDQSQYALRYSADGAYASLVTAVRYSNNYSGAYTTRVAIIDTATGAVTVTTLAGAPSSKTTFTTDGKYAVQTTTASRYAYADGTYTYASEIAVIETGTGAVTKVEVPVGLSGLAENGGGALDATGTRTIYLVTRDGSNGALFVDTATGTVTEYSVSGSSNVRLSEDRSRLIVQTYEYAPNTYQLVATRFSVVDTATGRQVGSTVASVGNQYGGYYANGNQIIVVVQDSSSGTTVARLTAIDLTTGTQVGSTATIGGPVYQLQYTADGSRAFVSQYGNGAVTVLDTATFTTLGTISNLGLYVSDVEFGEDRAVLLGRSGSSTSNQVTKVAIVDIATGAQLGSTLEVGGYGSAQFTADGSRVVISTPYSGTTSVAVLNASTGAQVGTTVTLVGSGQTNIDPTGSRAVMVARTYDSSTNSWTSSRLAVVDLATGTQIGTSFETSGYFEATLSPTGDVVAVNTREGVDASSYATRVTLLDTATGAQLGSTITQAGHGSLSFTADATRVAVYSQTFGGGVEQQAVTITVLDATSGAQLGNTITFNGQNRGFASTLDGTRLLVATFADDPAATHVVVVDVTTGTQAGDAVTLPGEAHYYDIRLSADGTRAILDTYGYGEPDNLHRVVVVDTVTGTTQTYAVRGEKLGAVRFASDDMRIIVDTHDDTAPGGVSNRTTIIEL